jgi:benzoate/toluate 1,2-dioxygenase beta subunit
MAGADAVTGSLVDSEAVAGVSSELTLRLRREQSVTAFVYRETDLLDANQLEEWMALYTEDGHYWIPLDWTPIPADTDPRDYGTGAGIERVNLVYDDKRRLRERIGRMRSGAFWDETPPSRVVRLLTNIQLKGDYEDDVGRSHVIVSSKTIVRQVRQSRENSLAGQVLHDLIENATPGGNAEPAWQIYLKKITLVNAEKPLWNMSYIL